MTERTISFYGKHLLVKRAPMAFKPGEEPPEMVRMTVVTMACPLSQSRDSTTRYRPCGRVIEIPVDLAPCAVICPECFGLFFVDDSTRQHQYADHDLSTEVLEGQSLFGYAVYPNHPAQRSLHRMIKQLTSGHSVLLAPMYNDEALETLGLSFGKFLRLTVGKSLDDLAELRLPPTKIATWICNMAHHLDQQEQWNSALALAQRAVVIAPQAGIGFATMGTAHQRLGNIHDAVKAYRRAIDTGFEPAHIHLNLGLALGALGDSDAEVEEYQRALAIDPELAQAHMNLAIEYSSRGQCDDAFRQLRTLLDIEPNHLQARLRLSWMYLDQRRWADAVREATEAIRISPDCADAYHNQGAGYFELGQLDEAIRSLSRAIQINPSDPDNHYSLGLAYWHTRRSEEAIREWQIAARLGHKPALNQLAMAMQ